ncbi:MAG: hypothetical protein ACRDEA_00275 [Microcystaceae cyanobacterium]
MRIDGFDIPTVIAHIAKTYRITQVVIGKTRQFPWPISLRRSLIDRLVELLGQADLHVISTEI